MEKIRRKFIKIWKKPLQRELPENSRDAVREHQSSKAYKDAADGMAYYNKHNITIEKFQKFLFTSLSGNKTPDIWSSDYRLKTLAFRRLVTQEVGYICANGVSMDEKEKLGADFDNKLQTAAKLALAQGVSYGYWNLDHLEVFSFADTPGNPGFVPLLDEKTSELMAGIRYWFRETGRKTVFRATLYGVDGVSEWSAEGSDDAQPMAEKRAYTSQGAEERSGHCGCVRRELHPPAYCGTVWQRYPRKRTLVGLRGSIDCYDFIKSGFANQN